MNLKVEAHLTAVANLITLVFLWSSAPYLMGAFVFVANCSFWSLGLLYTRKAFRDLRAGKCFREGQLKGF